MSLDLAHTENAGIIAEDTILYASPCTESVKDTTNTNIEWALVNAPHTISSALCEENFILMHVISPLYTQHTFNPIWVVQELGTCRGIAYSEGTKVKEGSTICLLNIGLSFESLGYERPLLFGTIQSLICSEPGYAITSVVVHFHMISPKLKGILIKSIDTPIPDHLYDNHTHVPLYHTIPTIWQCFVIQDGILHVRPPFQVWEEDAKWKHPKEREIKRWYQMKQWKMEIHCLGCYLIK
jgi:hypothetical protein